MIQFTNAYEYQQGHIGVFLQIAPLESVRDHLQECVNSEFVWQYFKQGLIVKVSISRAVRLRECLLRERRLYKNWPHQLSHHRNLELIMASGDGNNRPYLFVLYVDRCGHLMFVCWTDKAVQVRALGKTLQCCLSFHQFKEYINGQPDRMLGGNQW